MSNKDDEMGCKINNHLVSAPPTKKYDQFSFKLFRLIKKVDLKGDQEKNVLTISLEKHQEEIENLESEKKDGEDLFNMEKDGEREGLGCKVPAQSSSSESPLLPESKKKDGEDQLDVDEWVKDEYPEEMGCSIKSALPSKSVNISLDSLPSKSKEDREEVVFDKNVFIVNNFNKDELEKKEGQEKDIFANFQSSDFAQYLKGEINKKLRLKLHFTHQCGPTVVQLIQEGYEDFVKSVYDQGITYSSILALIDLKLLKVVRNDRSINSLAKELSYITQYLKEVLNLEPNTAPTLNQLVTLGYRGFVIFLHKNNIDYTDVTKAAGLVYRNWRVDLLNYDDFLALASLKGVVFPISREQFDKLMKNRNFSPSHTNFSWLCEKHGKWETTYQTLSNSKYGCPKCYLESTFITYLDCCRLAKSKRCEFTMTSSELDEIIKNERKIAETENREPKKPSDLELLWRCGQHGVWKTTYNVLNNSRIGCPKCAMIVWREENSLNYRNFIELNSEILEFGLDEQQFKDFLKNRTKHPSDEPAPWRCLKNPSHGIWKAPFNNIALGHGCPLCGERTRIISIYIHIIIEYHILKFLDSKNCNAEYEEPLEFGSIPDMILSRDSNFINIIEKFQTVIKVPEYITEIALEFTYTLDKRIIVQKCLKNYQLHNRLLLLVLLRDNNIRVKKDIKRVIALNDEIENSKNIKVLDINDFMSFLIPKKFESADDQNLRNKILYAQNLGLSAINAKPELQDEMLSKVKKEGERIQELLKARGDYIF